MATTYLDRILAHHRALAEADSRAFDALVEEALTVPETRGFREHLACTEAVSVIAEIKRRSPSKGELAPDLDPAFLGRAYEAGGAACVSVLTDSEYFGGSASDLRNAREAVTIPVLRKDFTVTEADVCDARIMGADALLLIVAALSAAELEDLLDFAGTLGIDALVEVHDEPELERAIDAGATLVGVNQRDLVTFEVDTARALRVVSSIPDHVIKVAESGISGPDDVMVLADAGFDAVLVGESLVRSGDPARGVAELCRAGLGSRGSRMA